MPPKLHALAYRTAYRIPVKWRRRLVRMVVPRYTIGSVILVRDADAPEPGRIVLLRQPPGHGWSLPAGLLDRRESPLDAAVRELFEETGIKVAAGGLTPATPNAVVHVDGRWVDCVFEVRVPGDVELRGRRRRGARGGVVPAGCAAAAAVVDGPAARRLRHRSVCRLSGSPGLMSALRGPPRRR